MKTFKQRLGHQMVGKILKGFKELRGGQTSNVQSPLWSCSLRFLSFPQKTINRIYSQVISILIRGNEVTPFRLGYRKKIIRRIIWFSLKMHSIKYNTDLKKKSYPSSVCLFILGVVGTGLSVKRELVAHGTEWKGGLWAGRAGEGASMEEFLIGHWAIFLSEMARRATASSLPPIYSGLCWCRGWQLKRQWGTVPDNFVTRERVSRDKGAHEPQMLFRLPGGEVSAFSKCSFCAGTEKCHRESRSNWAKSHVCATRVKRTRLGKRNQLLARAMIVDCRWLRFKLQRIKLSAGFSCCFCILDWKILPQTSHMPSTMG